MPEPDSTRNTEFIEKLDTIKNTLTLSIQQLTELFNVPPVRVYDWYDGITPPTTDIIQRTNALIIALKTVPPDANLRRLKSIWKIPILNKSFLSMFQLEPVENLQDKIITKFKEIHFLLSCPSNKPKTRPKSFGNAHLAEFDRMVSFD